MLCIYSHVVNNSVTAAPSTVPHFVLTLTVYFVPGVRFDRTTDVAELGRGVVGLRSASDGVTVTK